jgi:hypothetical protein
MSVLTSQRHVDVDVDGLSWARIVYAQINIRLSVEVLAARRTHNTTCRFDKRTPLSSTTIRERAKF